MKILRMFAGGGGLQKQLIRGTLLEKSKKCGSELSRHLVDVLELFSAIFYNGA